MLFLQESAGTISDDVYFEAWKVHFSVEKKTSHTFAGKTIKQTDIKGWMI